MTKSNIRVGILVINYNYTHFLLQNLNFLNKISNSEVYVIDDQSSDGLIVDLKYKLGKSLFSTKGPKSHDNSINQLRAIKLGIEKLLTVDNITHVWVLDADDYPVIANNSKIFHELDEINVLRSNKINEKGDFISKENPIKGLFWLKNTTTSQFILCKKWVLKHYGLLFNEDFKDYWWDARICSIAKTKASLFEGISVNKIQHKANDSLRYSENILKKSIRYIKAHSNSLKLKLKKDSILISPENIERSKKLGFVFIHIPKTAGLAITSQLYNSEIHHFRVKSYINYGYYGPFVFIYRDPLERFRSSINYLSFNSIYENDLNWRISNTSISVSFQIIKSLLQLLLPNRLRKIHFRSYRYFLNNAIGTSFIVYDIKDLLIFVLAIIFNDKIQPSFRLIKSTIGNFSNFLSF